jgi:serine/threonine protein kinase/Flp pilus assembly protein TadD
VSRARHQRLEEVFHAAVDRPAAEREAYIASACADDPALAAEVRDLLARDARDGPTRDSDTMLVASEPARPTAIGPFRILGQIGEGGFAIVYLAQQDLPLRRQVALKVLKPGLDTRATLKRFEAERQALAVMNHDGIARIHDAGATDEGRPYFAMEYVPGEPITTYCDRHELNNRARLDLFASVCDAVHHAHQKGVIHRDLKPNNILVATVDNRPQIKVIDFGIAKATEPELAGQTLFTQLGQFIGTPEYMSPEQAGFGPGDVDTRTDIYSLGVVLYELLAGVPPFTPETLRQAGIAEIQRIIREVDPPRPSTRVSTLGDDTTEVARRHRTPPQTLVRELRGELDWVVLKAMEKDRERRYLSPAGFAADLRRFLRDEPLVARPPSRSYRLTKFARRNRLALGASLAVLLGLIGLSAGVTIALVEANRQRALTEAALDEAVAVTDFLVDMMGAARPYAQGRDVSVREILDLTAGSLATELADRPLIANRVRRTIGTTYAELGLFAEAESLLTQAVAEYERLLGSDHERTLRALQELGDLLLTADRLDEAAAIYEATYARQVRLHGERHRATLATLHEWGNVLANQSRYAEAESLLVRSWELGQEVFDPDSQNYLSFASNLANFYAETGRPEPAEPLLRLVLEGRTRVRGEEHPETLEAWNNLAMLYADQGRYQECIPFLRHAHELQDKLLGPGHHEALVTRNNLAAISALVFDWALAESLYIEGLAAAEQDRDPSERIIQYMINNLGYLQLQQGRFEAARTNLTRAHELRRTHLGAEHRDTYTSRNNLGELALLEGDLDTAEELLAPNVDARRELLGDGHPHVILALGNLGRLRLGQERLAEADALLSDAFAMASGSLGDAHRITIGTACHLGRVDLARAGFDRLESRARPLVAVADSSLAPADPLRGVLRLQLARSALARGRVDDATLWLDEAMPLLPERLTRATPWAEDLAEATRLLAQVQQER